MEVGKGVGKAIDLNKMGKLGASLGWEVGLGIRRKEDAVEVSNQDGW